MPPILFHIQQPLRGLSMRGKGIEELRVNAHKKLTSLDERPGDCAGERIAHPDIPLLRPVQIRVCSLPAHQPKRMECIMHGPFTFKRVDGPVPNKAIRMLLADGSQLPLEVILAYLEGRLESNVV